MEASINYDSALQEGTGSHFTEGYRIIEYPFDRYVVKIRVSVLGNFLGIEEIAVNRDFMSYMQKMEALRAHGVHDIERFYSEPEEDVRDVL